MRLLLAVRFDGEKSSGFPQGFARPVSDMNLKQKPHSKTLFEKTRK